MEDRTEACVKRIKCEGKSGQERDIFSVQGLSLKTKACHSLAE